MPETYTQEQISEAVRECDRFAEKHYDKEIAPYVEILSYALSIAERERDAALARCAELEGGLVAAIKSIDEGGAPSVKRIRKMLIDVLDAIVSKKEG